MLLTDDYLYVVRLEDLHGTYITGILLNSFGDVAIQNSFVYIAKDMPPGLVEYRLLNDSLYFATSVDSNFDEGAIAAISGQYLYDGDLYGGVKVFDVSNYLNIYEVAYYSGYRALDIAASNGYAFVSTGDMGLQIFALSGVGVNEGINNVLSTQFLITCEKKSDLYSQLRKVESLKFIILSAERCILAILSSVNLKSLYRETVSISGNIRWIRKFLAEGRYLLWTELFEQMDF